MSDLSSAIERIPRGLPADFVDSDGQQRVGRLEDWRKSGDVETVLRVPRSSAAQRLAWSTRARYILFRGGRGAGKTFTGAVWVASLPPGSQVLVCSPTYKNLASGALFTLVPLLRKCGLIRSYNKHNGEIETVDNKQIWIRSLDRPDAGVRGPNLSHIWGDEMAILKDGKAWRDLIGALRLGEHRQALVTTTPKKHWLYDFFAKSSRPHLRCEIQSHTRDNVGLPADVVDDLSDEMDDAYAEQELGGGWADIGAMEVYQPDKVAEIPLPPPPDKIKRTARAYDTAATGGGGDYTAGILLSIDDEKRLYIRDVVRGQWAPHDRDEKMRTTAEGDGPGVTISVAQERGSAGKSQQVYWVRQLVGYTVRAHMETGDKVVRAGPAAAQINAGNVRITCEPGRWGNYWHKGRRLRPDEARARFLANLGAFPAGRTKDESDALAAALDIVAQRNQVYLG